jgi:hypothetical protein
MAASMVEGYLHSYLARKKKWQSHCPSFPDFSKDGTRLKEVFFRIGSEKRQ